MDLRERCPEMAEDESRSNPEASEPTDASQLPGAGATTEPAPPVSEVPADYRPGEGPPQRRAWPLGLLLGLLNYPLAGMLAAAGSVGRGSVGEIAGCVLPFALLGAELVGGVILAQRRESFWGRVLLFGPLFSLAAAVVLVVFVWGICLVTGPPNFH